MCMHEEPHSNEFLNQVRQVCRWLASNTLTLPALREKLGELQLEAQAEPAPGSEEPGLVRLGLPTGISLTLDDLALEFGAYTQAAAMHHNRPLKYVFVVDDPEMPFVCRLVADKPRGEDTVTALTLRRDIRL